MPDEKKTRAPRRRDRSKTAIDPMTLLDSPRELAAQMYRRALARPNVPPETLLDIGVLVGMISQMVEPTVTATVIQRPQPVPPGQIPRGYADAAV